MAQPGSLKEEPRVRECVAFSSGRNTWEYMARENRVRAQGDVG